MYLHQYDYIFAIGTLFAMLDAYNNGASEYHKGENTMVSMNAN